jgi:hypothetical protein
MASNLAEMFEENPPPSLSGMSADEIIREFIRLDTLIKDLAYQRSEYSNALTQAATDVRSGQSTVHMETSDRKEKVKVEFRKGWECDQAEVECARELLKDERFNEIFKTEYTPKVAKLRTFLNTKSSDEAVEVARQIIKEAVKEVEKSPYCSIEKR